MDTLAPSGLCIPLQQKEEFGLGKLSPNYLIIDSIQGINRFNTYNLQTGEKQEQDCMQVSYRLVTRMFMQDERINEILVLSDSIFVPVDFIPRIFSKERIVQNVQLINTVFQFFQFSEPLKDLKLIINETLL